ncbi:hypothetical protein [Solitalea lacus]|uniref:hypothetical protein n=1 Tax=Solitalea lacus TaxID=2911172 RepID=UPI001EDB8A97|nr:hypothetical protein [Solitalea lacus]UKJ07221.1 hypothetical protein L2B55_17045 [Solitalea lacus]
MKSIVFTFYCTVLLLFSIEESANAQSQTGVYGIVVFKSGNQMPSPDIPKEQRGGKAVRRSIYIYELTNVNETKAEGVFYSELKTKLIKQVKSDKNGRFSAKLKPGKYSVFVKEEKGLFANMSDGDQNICPIIVKNGQMTELNLVIDYNAAY